MLERKQPVSDEYLSVGQFVEYIPDNSRPALLHEGQYFYAPDIAQIVAITETGYLILDTRNELVRRLPNHVRIIKKFLANKIAYNPDDSMRYWLVDGNPPQP